VEHIDLIEVNQWHIPWHGSWLRKWREEAVMKPRLIDRLFIIGLVLNLILAFWWLSVRFAFHEHMPVRIF
jgi:hypothetical protein